MTDIVKFFVVFYSCKKHKGGKNMLSFDEYVTKMEERRAQEQRAGFNAAIAQGLRERTHGETVAALYAALTFVGGVSDVLSPLGGESTLQRAL